MFLDLPDFSAKCLQLLIESVPTLTRVGVLWDPTTGSLQLNAVRTAAQTLRVNLEVFEARHIADIADVFYALNLSHTHGVLILSSPLFGGNPQVVADLAMRKRIPTISLFPDTARRGGLLAYGPDIQGLFSPSGGYGTQGAARREARGYTSRTTDAIRARGTQTARLFGITLPTSILLRADEVIE